MNNKKKQTIEQTPESNEREVTLLTSDRELEDFLIVTYPHAITEEQHKVHKELNCKISFFTILILILSAFTALFFGSISTPK